MENFEALVNIGMDVDNFLKRLMGNTMLVGRFVQKFTEDTNFENLTEAFVQKDMKAAEHAGHTLKGMWVIFS